MMQPPVPFFIVLNTLLEALVVPLALYLGWHQPRQRYRRTMEADYRGVLVLICHGLFLLAAPEQGTLRRRPSRAGA